MQQQTILEQKFGRFRKKYKQPLLIERKLAVMMTRVSGKRQLENDSIEVQHAAIHEYAEKNNIQIMQAFGGTNESAKTDERKEFQKMIEYCRKSRGRINTILVYKISRFSRTGTNAMSIAEKLRTAYGIHIISVSEHIDTTNENGVIFQELQMLFAKWDNVQRQQITSAGMIAKYNKGIWLGKPPQGYVIVKQDGERKIILNDEGKKIRKAWDWKLQGFSNEQIVEKLKDIGVKMYKQQISKIFANPFYCGIVAHGLLDGQVREGLHEKMISKEVFFKINEVRMNNSRLGVPHKRENDDLPLRVFCKCSVCGESLTGYVVKKKNLYYYKCSKKGCNLNKSAKQMHELFLGLLKRYIVKEELVEPIAYQIEHEYNALNVDKQKFQQQYKERLAEVSLQIKKLDTKFYVTEEITKDKYDYLTSDLREQYEQISQKLELSSKTISNLNEKLVQALGLCVKLPSIWQQAGFEEKGMLQKMIFPDGIEYDKKSGRLLTFRVNSIFKLIACDYGDLDQIKTGLNTLEDVKSRLAGKKVQISNDFAKDLGEILDFIDRFRPEIDAIGKEPEISEK